LPSSIEKTHITGYLFTTASLKKRLFHFFLIIQIIIIILQPKTINMIDNYFISESTPQITLSISVSTVGVAYTSVCFEGEPLLAESDTSTAGSVRETIIGNANHIKNKWLSIHTEIDFTHIAQNTRENAIQSIVIKYCFSDGISEPQSFGFSPSNLIKLQNGKNVLIVKSIHLI
jgi:hypothetical protein